MQVLYSQTGIIPKSILDDGTLEVGIPVSLKSDGTYTKFTSSEKNYVGIAVDDSIVSPADTQGVQKMKCSVCALGFMTAKVKTTVTAGALISVEEGGIKPATASADAIGKTLEAGNTGDYVLVILDNVSPTIA